MLRGRIGSSDNHRKSLQRFIGELILFYDASKAALRAIVSKFDVHHIERYRIFTVSLPPSPGRAARIRTQHWDQRIS